jgi:hypothetical protein
VRIREFGDLSFGLGDALNLFNQVLPQALIPDHEKLALKAEAACIEVSRSTAANPKALSFASGTSITGARSPYRSSSFNAIQKGRRTYRRAFRRRLPPLYRRRTDGCCPHGPLQSGRAGNGPELAFALGRFAPIAIALVVNCETRKRSFVVGTDCSSSLSPETIKTIGFGRCEIDQRTSHTGLKGLETGRAGRHSSLHLCHSAAESPVGNKMGNN